MTAGSIHALLWTILNLIALATSGSLLVDLVVASEDPTERPGAASFYLVWNFGTTLLWVTEVSFRALAWRKAIRTPEVLARRRIRAGIALIVEWSLAIYFTFDAIHLLRKWKLQKEDFDADTIEVFLNTAGFAYISIASYRDYLGSSAEGQYAQVQGAESTPIVEVGEQRSLN
jgi:hypothetical protein